MSEVRFGKASFESIDSNEALLSAKQLPTGEDALVPEALACQPSAEATAPAGLAGARVALTAIERLCCFLSPSSAALDR